MARVEVPEWIPGVGPNSRKKGVQLGETHRSRLEDALLGLAETWADDPVRGLAILAAAIQDLTTREVQRQRRDGATWREVGEALGISKQAAQQRYDKKY